MSIEAVGIIPTWSIGDRLRKARELAGFDQGQLANALDISRNTVSNYEKGNVEPRKIVLKAWSFTTGVSLTWLETGVAPSPNGEGATNLSPLPGSIRRPYHYE
ncbi:helix-turn-helix domain-containing protein [Arthrobacter sp. UM1]|uniref:helix-turn-helix domain-containing protein n=1 Tax=Arthrobacter sp. UM1 TaxID=2766776 RepID=UPI001CF68261|nr:helix-turn-helix transcriptional regulator [Arthrobacter sp. UM1]